MSEKITIQDIIELLAEKHNMSPKEADIFVKSMFELIEDALTIEKYVKVKGFGTFKLMEVKSREGVNIDARERIEIQGHAKISFTPDSNMKNLINKPFAHFETVILNEKTKLKDVVIEIEGEKEETFEDIVTNIIEETIVTENVASAELAEEINSITDEDIVIFEETLTANKPIVAEKLNTTEEETLESSEANLLSSEQENIIKESKKSIEDIITATIDLTQKTIKEEPIITIADSARIASCENKTLAESISLMKSNSSKESSTKEVVLTNPTYKAEKGTRISCDISNTSKTKVTRKVIIVIILMCIAGGIYWYLQSKIQPLIPIQSNSLVLQKRENSKVLTPINDSLTQHKDTANILIHIPKQESTTLSLQDTKTINAKKLSSIAKETSLADTVEYDITGTKTNYTLQEGESLVKLAVKFYGTKKLWPYIVRHNKNIIKDANKVPVGTILRIPELTPKTKES